MKLSIVKYQAHSKKNAGFTLIEMMITLGILLTLFGIAAFNLINTQRVVTIDSSVNTLISDIKNQQLDAMIGSGQINPGSYGIYFMPNQYILFEGGVYNSSNNTNFTVNLDSGITISGTTIPNNTLIFSHGSGEMLGYTQYNNSITVMSSSDSKQKTITLNRYGLIVGIN